jgi:putative SOS response-associated peptidase YedK
MCGRFTTQRGGREMAGLFGATPTGESLGPSFNVAPGQLVQTVVQTDEGRLLVPMRWGLIPSWAKDAAIGNRLINARAETVSEKPAFRKAFRERRCLILADGFYEWKTEEGLKRPWHITLADQEIFAFAGIWERWTPESGEPVQSCAIITVEANEFMRAIHARMPAILPEEDQEAWLDPSNKDPALLLPLLKPYPSEGMRGHEVSTYVNRPANNSPQCVLPLE